MSEVVERPIRGRAGVERLGYLIGTAPSLFARLFVPEAPVVIVVVVPTLASDRLFWSHPVEELSSALVRLDVAVLSFDFRGEGLSEGLESRTSESFAEDISAVLVTARETGLPVGLLGVGAGGLFASVSADIPTLAWGTPASGDAFFKGLTRAKLVSQMGFANGEGGLLDVVVEDSIADAMAVAGSLDLGGFVVERSLYESVRALTVPESTTKFEGGESPSRVASVVRSRVVPG